MSSHFEARSDVCSLYYSSANLEVEKLMIFGMKGSRLRKGGLFERTTSSYTNTVKLGPLRMMNESQRFIRNETFKMIRSGVVVKRKGMSEKVAVVWSRPRSLPPSGNKPSLK